MVFDPRLWKRLHQANGRYNGNSLLYTKRPPERKTSTKIFVIYHFSFGDQSTQGSLHQFHGVRQEELHEARRLQHNLPFVRVHTVKLAGFRKPTAPSQYCNGTTVEGIGSSLNSACRPKAPPVMAFTGHLPGTIDASAFASVFIFERRVGPDSIPAGGPPSGPHPWLDVRGHSRQPAPPPQPEWGLR